MNNQQIAEQVQTSYHRLQRLRMEIVNCNPLIRNHELVKEADSAAWESMQLMLSLCTKIRELQEQINASNQ